MLHVTRVLDQSERLRVQKQTFRGREFPAHAVLAAVVGVVVVCGRGRLGGVPRGPQIPVF